MTDTTRVNANVRSDAVGSLSCSHCGHRLEGTSANYLSRVPRHVGPPSDGGPHLFADPSVYVDAEVVFRQFFCPGCYVALHTEVVPADAPVGDYEHAHAAHGH